MADTHDSAHGAHEDSGHAPHDQHGEHGHGDGGHGGGPAHHHAGGTTKQYLTVCGALCALTLVSFVTFRLLHTRSLEATWAVMMAVSCMKALLVMLFFMHLKWEASWKYILTIPATIMALFLIVALVPDVKWRLETIAGGRTPATERLRHVGAKAEQLQHLGVSAGEETKSEGHKAGN